MEGLRFDFGKSDLFEENLESFVRQLEDFSLSREDAESFLMHDDSRPLRDLLSHLISDLKVSTRPLFCKALYYIVQLNPDLTLWLRGCGVVGFAASCVTVDAESLCCRLVFSPTRPLPADPELVFHALVVLSCVCAAGSTLDVVDLGALDESFVTRLFDVFESATEARVSDACVKCAVRYRNAVLKMIFSHPAKVHFCSMVLEGFNKDPSVARLSLRFLNEVFADKATASLFSRNDLSVIIDICLRELNGGVTLSQLYLAVVRGLIEKSQYDKKSAQLQQVWLTMKNLISSENVSILTRRAAEDFIKTQNQYRARFSDLLRSFFHCLHPELIIVQRCTEIAPMFVMTPVETLSMGDQALVEATSILGVLNYVINKLVKENDKRSRFRREVTVFNALKTPEISVEKYLQRIEKYTKATRQCFVMSLIYLDRLMQQNRWFLVNSSNIHRLLITSMMLSCKFFDDIFYTNTFYAAVGGVPSHEMNALELEFLFLINFKLLVNDREYSRYERYLRRQTSVLAGQAQVPDRLLLPVNGMPVATPKSSQSGDLVTVSTADMPSNIGIRSESDMHMPIDAKSDMSASYEDVSEPIQIVRRSGGSQYDEFSIMSSLEDHSVFDSHYTHGGGLGGGHSGSNIAAHGGLRAMASGSSDAVVEVSRHQGAHGLSSDDVVVRCDPGLESSGQATDVGNGWQFPTLGDLGNGGAGASGVGDSTDEDASRVVPKDPGQEDIPHPQPPQQEQQVVSESNNEMVSTPGPRSHHPQQQQKDVPTIGGSSSAFSDAGTDAWGAQLQQNEEAFKRVVI